MNSSDNFGFPSSFSNHSNNSSLGFLNDFAIHPNQSDGQSLPVQPHLYTNVPNEGFTNFHNNTSQANQNPLQLHDPVWTPQNSLFEAPNYNNSRFANNPFSPSLLEEDGMGYIGDNNSNNNCMDDFGGPIMRYFKLTLFA